MKSTPQPPSPLFQLNYTYHHTNKGESSTIPPNFPVWRKLSILDRTEKFYGRRSLTQPGYITIFDLSARSKYELPREVVEESFILGERCTAIENHKVEDMFECLYLSGRARTTIKNI